MRRPKINNKIKEIKKLQSFIKQKKAELKQLREELYLAMEKMYKEEGLSIIEIGKKLGFSKVWVFTILRKRKVIPS